ncbi:hypothetical protein BS78_03G020800 [Paspalum vaginatum]|nr:hypothetical protein BS78_03G020800 [Paspalum vaginatum]
MAAALRSTLAMLSRGSSGSSAAAHMGGRGLEINHVFRHAAQPLHPAAVRKVEGYRSFSTGIKEPADKVKGGMCMWYQRVRNRMKNATLEERSKGLFVYGLFVMGTPTVIMLKEAGHL